MAEKFFGLTDTGRMRDNNEDSFIAEQVLKNRFVVACVIDGVGGYEGGEVAASIARQAILDYLSVPSGDLKTMLREAVVSANEKIFREKKITGKNDRMACVLTLVLIEKKSNKFHYAHVGDTRLYLYRDLSLVKVTSDHSFVGFLEDQNRISEAEAMSHPKRNEINKALGFSDHISNPSDFVETGESPFLPGDILLLCSDGLTDLVNRQNIGNILSEKTILQEKARALIDAANEAGGKDNITVVLVHNDAKSTKLSAVKPAPGLKKNETIAPQSETPIPVTRRKNNSAVVALTILSLILAAALVWQMTSRPNKEVNDGVNPKGSISASGRNQLADSLGRPTGDTLILSPSIFGDTIMVNEKIKIESDSLVIIGSGTTIMAEQDTRNSQNAVIEIKAGIKHILFQDVTFSGIDIEMSPDDIEAVHFKEVKFMNSAVNIRQKIVSSDSLFSGRIDDIKTEQRNR